MPFAPKPRNTVASSAEPALMQVLTRVDHLLGNDLNGRRFPDDLENDFQKESSDARANNFVKICIIGIIAYNAFLFSDYFIITDMFVYDLIFHFIVTLSMFFSLYLVVASKLSPQNGVLINLLLIVFSVIILYAISRSELSGYIVFTVPLIICFGNIVLPLQFMPSIWFTSISISGICIATMLRPDWHSSLSIFSFMLNVNTGFYMVVGTHRGEMNERRAFLFNLRDKLRADILSARLNHERNLLQSVLDTSPDAMLLFDINGTIASFSPSAEQMFGWNASSVVGKNICVLMTQSACAEYERHFGGLFSLIDLHMISKSRELDAIRHDGSIFPMMLHVREVILGENRQFTGIIHDLTQLKEAHDRSQDLRTQLVHIWSMNSLGEMAAILAHELNQPLTAIANYLQGARTLLVNVTDVDDDLVEAVDRAGTQALRAGEIIRRMRSLIAKANSHHREESLKEVISEIDFMTRLVAREADVTVRYNFSAHPDVVYVDRIQIQQVVSNLVRNACEAMHGQPERILEISTRRDDQTWNVSINDSGPGIASEIAEKLFVPLATSKPQGMGLGLTVSRAIIHHHRGELLVGTSHLGGAAFGFTLPMDSSV